MTIWQPDLSDLADRPRYVAIADALARDVESGALAPGDRLPTHRELARRLAVTVGTVTRGYAEAERRGLTAARVGRGTFVRQRIESEWTAAETDGIDLSLNLPVIVEGEERAFAAALRDIAASARIGRLLRYDPALATAEQRLAAARWISRTGLDVEADDVLVTAGAQHALTVIFSALLRPGDVVLTGELTYPGVKSLARTFGLRLQGLDLDAEGIVPESFDRACERGAAQDRKPAALYCVPTLQNPTCVTMSSGRRAQIAEIAERHDVWILEDDVHAFLPSEPPTPIAGFAPARTLYLASVAKCLDPGLRIGFLVARPELRERLLSGVRSTIWMPPPLMTEIVCRWLEDGTADRLLVEKRAESAARQRLAARCLEGFELRGDPNAHHLWLELPAPWRSDELVEQAQQRGVRIAGSEAFAVGRDDLPHSVRVSLGNVASRQRLEEGLETLAGILRDGADPYARIV